MQRRHEDLRGLSLEQAQARARAMIEAIHEEYLEEYEVILADSGTDVGELAAKVADYRTQIAGRFEKFIDEVRACMARGLKDLH